MNFGVPMPHIPLPADLPGIRGAMAFRPETARPLNALVEVLLQGPSTLSPVSYTHLDVYKRQECLCGFWVFGAHAIRPVRRSTTI